MSIDLEVYTPLYELAAELDSVNFEISALRELPLKEPSKDEKFAKEAISRFFNWLEESPNNPTYLESSAYLLPMAWLKEHQDTLEQDLQLRHSHLTDKFKDVDRQNLDAVTDFYDANDIAYAGIRHIIKAAQNLNVDRPVEKINRTMIAAIGATTVRMEYLSNEVLLPEEIGYFESKYRQNIISDIRHAALLQNRAAKSPPVDAQ